MTFARLIARFGHAEAALEALPRLGLSQPPPREEAEREIEAIKRFGAQLAACCEPDFPPLLAALEPPPPILCFRGDPDLAKRDCLAIVGAREASAAGLKMARQLAADLSEAGFVIVSGMARGIDAQAHAASLERGAVAVLAGGLDRPYPPENMELYEALLSKGLVVAEAAMGAQARAKDFPKRNHIISGLSRAVIVVEAEARSGSLITARAALQQGRDVMAVPGSPLDPRARGCNALLKEGAALIESAADVLAALNAAPTASPRPANLPLFDAPLKEPKPPESLNADLEHRLARLLSPTPVHLDDLARLLSAPAARVAAAAAELEFAGRAITYPGGYLAAAPE